MRLPVIGLGAGGHAKVVIDILSFDKQYEVVGFLDPVQGTRQVVCGIPILGDDRYLPAIRERGIRHFFIGLGSISDIKPRQRLYEFAIDHGMIPIPAVHPHAVISQSVRLGAGATVMAGAVLNIDAHTGDNVIINTCAVIEHDCVIGNHVHVATGAILGGAVEIGDGTHVGAGAVIRQGVIIGNGVVIGAGAVVVRNVPDHHKVVGNPANRKL